jgi:hypothetical protein
MAMSDDNVDVDYEDALTITIPVSAYDGTPPPPPPIVVSG